MNTNNASWLCDPLSPHAEVKGFRDYYPFESWVNMSWRLWWQRNWTLCFWIAGVYVVATILGQRMMRNRPAFRLRRPLLLWNMLISISSLWACQRVGTEILEHVRRDGFRASICDLGPLEHQVFLGSYLLFFIFSRVVELGDTAFLVLRRKPVPFEHCFHHIVIMLATWANSGYPSVVAAYFMALNFGMHFQTYGLMTLKMLHVRFPPVMVPLQLSLELMQSLFGLGITLYTQSIKRSGATCCLYDETVNLVYGLYIAFAIVFFKLTYDAFRYWMMSPKIKKA